MSHTLLCPLVADFSESVVIGPKQTFHVEDSGLVKYSELVSEGLDKIFGGKYQH